MNINNFSRLYRRTQTGTGETGSVVRLRIGPIDAKTLRVLTHVTVENQTSGYTKCRLGISGSSGNIYIDELTSISAEELAVSRSDILLGEGDYFFAEFTGTTTGDTLIMHCIGWELDL